MDWQMLWIPFRHKYFFDKSLDIAIQVMEKIGGAFGEGVKRARLIDEIENIHIIVENGYFTALSVAVNKFIKYAFRI